MPLSPEPTRTDEGRHHRETTASIRLKAQRLRRALDADRLHDAIKIAADVAAELRSPSAAELSPKSYYDIYLAVCAELRLLEMYVMESARRGAPVLELYERVQETPLVLPRLYLLVTAGSVYVNSMQAPAKDVLRDLVAMCAGVQHPQRALFLRAYLAQMMKDKLPTAIEPNEDDLAGGTMQDSIDFVIRNFSEMNELWVRMQHNAATRDMDMREKERMELRLLVGSNIATLSRLVGSNLDIYRKNVLPAILEQIVSCNDAIAQEYLADCVAQVFPDDFQLATLESFMQMCGKLVKGVNMKTILVSIIDRLTKYVAASADAKKAAKQANAFAVFREQLPKVLQRQGSTLALTDRLHIYVSLMKFSLDAETERMDYVDDVLRFCVTDMEAFVNGHQDSKDPMARLPRTPTKQKKTLDAKDERLALQVLTNPLDSFKSVGSVLKLENYVVLQRYLNYDNQKSLAARLLKSTAGYTPCIANVATLEKLFQYVAPLVQERSVGEEEDEQRDEMYEKFDVASLTHHHEYILSSIPVSHSHSNLQLAEAGQTATEDVKAVDDEVTFARNQELVARIVYLCEDDDIEKTLELYTTLRRELVRGGGKRMALTMPSLVFACLRLALRVGGGEVVEKILGFAAESVSFLPESAALLALRLRLHVATTAANLGGEVSRFVYDNISGAFVGYEEHVTSSREQHIALELIIVRLGQARESLDAESFEALSRRAIKHSSRSLTRSDQCILLCLCAELFDKRYGDKAMMCLKRALEAAECCVNSAERVLLLLDVARCAVMLQENEVCDVCEDGFLDGVVKQVRLVVSGRRAKGSAFGKLVVARYQRLVAHLRQRLDIFAGLEASEL